MEGKKYVKSVLERDLKKKRVFNDKCSAAFLSFKIERKKKPYKVHNLRLFRGAVKYSG